MLTVSLTDMLESAVIAAAHRAGMTVDDYVAAACADALSLEIDRARLDSYLTNNGGQTTVYLANNGGHEQRGTDHGLSHPPNNSPVASSITRGGRPDFPGTARRPNALVTCVANAAFPNA